ncbi:hypothetical protein D3C81_1967920 [compost metagenome]
MLQMERALHVTACKCTCLQQSLEASLINNIPAAAAGVRTDVNDMIRQLDYIGIMLNDDHCITLVAQLLQQFI